MRRSACRRGRPPVAAIARRPHARAARPLGPCSSEPPAFSRFFISSRCLVALSTISQPRRPRTLASCSAAFMDAFPSGAATARSYQLHARSRRLPPRRTPRRRAPRRRRSCPTSIANSFSSLVRLLSCSPTIGALKLRPDDDPLERELQRRRRADAGEVLDRRRRELDWRPTPSRRNTQSGSP